MTHNGGLMLPVLLACATSYALSVLLQSRSMLTADMSRRGLHLTRELGVDPLESMLVSQAMHTSVFAMPETATQQHAADWLRSMNDRGPEAWSHWQRIFPVVDADGKLVAMLTRSQLISIAEKGAPETKLRDIGVGDPQTISPTHTLKACAVSMAESGLTSYPVVAADGKLLGIMTINDLLKGRSQQEHRESSRARVLRLRWPFGGNREILDGPVINVVTVTGTAPQATVGEKKAAAEAAADDELVTRG
jgi:CBS domain-containing protein